MPEALEKTEVLLQRAAGVATLTLSYPAKRNPLGTLTAQELGDRLAALDADEEVRVVVLTGAGQAFSAGGDLREFLGTVGASATAHWETGGPWARLYGMIPKMGKPVIAKVRGPALAGGLGLVAACDLAVAAEGASFATPEVKIGLFPLFILPALVRCVGRRQALEMALTAKTLSAPEALRAGLLNAVVPDSELDGAVENLARALSGMGSKTLRMGKYAFREIADASYDEGLEIARGIRGAFLGSEELRAGISKFLGKSGSQPEAAPSQVK